jgi:hypothetical protein
MYSVDGDPLGDAAYPQVSAGGPIHFEVARFEVVRFVD